MSESPEGRWKFYTDIAEELETMRRKAGSFAKANMPEDPQESRAMQMGASLLAFELRQAEKCARELAGPRGTKPETGETA